MKKLIPLLILTMISGCWSKKPTPTPTSSVPVETKPEPKPEPTTEPTRVDPDKSKFATPRWETIKNKDNYTTMAHEELLAHGQYLLQGKLADVKEFCTKCTASRLDMMTYLLSTMAEKESYFRPELEYKESFKDTKGRNVISTGLFQLSLESSQQKRYSCGFEKQSDLYSERGNIRCAIKILNALSKENGRLHGRVNGAWQGGSRYWSVLRTTRADAYNFIIGKMKETF